MCLMEDRSGECVIKDRNRIDKHLGINSLPNTQLKLSFRKAFKVRNNSKLKNFKVIAIAADCTSEIVKMVIWMASKGRYQTAKNLYKWDPYFSGIYEQLHPPVGSNCKSFPPQLMLPQLDSTCWKCNATNLLSDGRREDQ
ncbi:hypothetical protein TNCV_998981 [Trichonephila clavipes]|nr:hypothetical protein TNCV_998981 [Trichonephila clavipes]